MTTVAAQLYTLREVMRTPEQIEAGFARLSKDGWKAVQVSGIGPMEPAKLRALADKYGLEICATHIPMQRLLDDAEGVVKEHDILGCKYIGIGGMDRKLARAAEGFRQFARQMTPVGEKLKAAGKVFLYHNHDFELVRFGGLTGLDILLQESGEAVTFEPDTYWLQAGGGDSAQWIGKMAGRVEVVHFKDMAYEPEEGHQVMAEVGEGNLNWPAIVAACRKANVRWHIVEQDTCRRDPFDSLKMSLENLKRMGLS
jgi:sugar phosphate isomerase/epimerase